MTRTKWLRRALLGGAALSVMATGAQADELTALKAQLEALQARVSQIETQPAPVVPTGASMLTVRRGQLTSGLNLPQRKSDELYSGDQQGYTIAVTPTADMPAPVSEVTVSAQIRARLLYSDDDKKFLDADFGLDDDDYNGFNVDARGRLLVEGKTETAVGEVGGAIRLESAYDEEHTFDDSEDVDMDIAWGYWQMTPNWQLGGGYADSTGHLLAGVDNQHNDDMTGGVNAFTNSDDEQIRLTFTSGGLTLAVGVEDNDAECSDYTDAADVIDGSGNVTECDSGDTESDIPGIAARGLFDTGSFVIAAAANWVKDDRDCGDLAVDDDCADDWSVGLGINGKFVEVFSWTIAGAIGEGNATGTRNISLAPGADDEWWGVSAGFIWGFASAMSLQVGAGYAEVERKVEIDDVNEDEESLDVTATLFYDPVDQLTLGLGVGYHENEIQSADGDQENYWVGGFGAYFRF